MIPALTAAYALLAVAYLLLFGYNDSWTGAIVKMLPVLLLAAASVRLMRGAWRRGMVAALLFSALGDWLLGMNGVTGNLFTAGLGSFLLAQLAYAQLFWRHRSPDRRRRWLAACYLPVAAVLAWLVLPEAGAMAVPVTLYMLAITAMVTGAALADRPLMLLAGALAFAFSDATIAINKFLAPVPQSGLVIMLSYYLAQWLLWRGALREPEEIPR
ncbi:MAG: lysoplasmalogenase [Pseudomonadales bacterium]|nr:lysoplasmalogenase [Pseudomonadales bacterium]MBP9034100.1 lysoplasmalogenase [Pseudomonadales bacterium]